MFRMAYEQGAQDALTKFALAMPKLSPDVQHKVIELAGIGLIAAPVVHSFFAGEENDSPTLRRAKHLSDLTGLGLLAVPHFLPKH